MPYVGRPIDAGDFKVITLSESFDGSRVDFGSNSSGDSFAKSETFPLFANKNFAEGKRGDDSSDVSEVAVDMFDDGFKFDGDNNPESNGWDNTPVGKHIYIAFA